MKLPAAVLLALALGAGSALHGQDDALSLARRLAGERRFAEALAAYDELLARDPGRREAALGRAETLLFAGRYREAEEAYLGLEREAPGEPEAMRGLARAAYWSGDFRLARTRFRALALRRPQDREVREALAAFDALTCPSLSASAEGTSDSQPADLPLARLQGRAWLDPLTPVEVEAGAGRIDAPDLPGATGIMRARLSLSTKLPRQRLTLALSAGLLRVGDAGRLLASALLERDLSQTLRASAGIERGAALDSAPSYRAAVASEQAFLRVSRNDAPLTGAAEARLLRWHDGNAGLSAHVWAEARLLERGALQLFAGGALAWRDTRESRTRAVFDGAVSLPTGGFAYHIRTLFDPYVTPERQLEGRALARATLRPEKRLRLDLSAEWGAGRERATGWGPAEGPSPAPPLLASGTFARTYQPWKASLAAEWSAETWSVRGEAIRSSSAYYTATTIGLAFRRTL